jgi:phosphate-selective porin OprO/OprP
MSHLSRLLLLAAAMLAMASLSAHAQTEDLPPPPPGYDPVVPEAIESALDKTAIQHDLINIKWGIVPILDYTWFGQDPPSVDQVGVQENAFQVRSGRVMARGSLFNTSSHPWKFLVSFEYRGFDSNPDDTWSWTDVWVQIPVAKVGNLTIGKEKEGFSYEIVGDAANLVQVERLMNTFAGTRNVGLKLSGNAFQDRASWSFGVFNDWFQQDLSFDESGTQVVGRVTTLAHSSDDGAHYLHLGGSFRRNGADQDSIRYKGRPESNVTDYYVDTGSLPADHAQQFAFELLWNRGPFSLTGEYTEAHVHSLAGGGNPNFRGWYAVGSWVVTGEHRPYDTKVGYARRILPKGNWGALELFARYGLVDLDDKEARGGYLTKLFLGANWWVNRRIRLSAGYGRAALDKLGVTGHTNQYFTRVQWVY